MMQRQKLAELKQQVRAAYRAHLAAIQRLAAARRGPPRKPAAYLHP